MQLLPRPARVDSKRNGEIGLRILAERLATPLPIPGFAPPGIHREIGICTLTGLLTPRQYKRLCPQAIQTAMSPSNTNGYVLRKAQTATSPRQYKRLCPRTVVLEMPQVQYSRGGGCTPKNPLSPRIGLFCCTAYSTVYSTVEEAGCTLKNPLSTKSTQFH